jgi:hypothetical protein
MHMKKKNGFVCLFQRLPEFHGLDGASLGGGRDSPAFGKQAVDSLQRNDVSTHAVLEVVGGSNAHGQEPLDILRMFFLFK